jgi:hypothetical protein
LKRLACVWMVTSAFLLLVVLAGPAVAEAPRVLQVTDVVQRTATPTPPSGPTPTGLGWRANVRYISYATSGEGSIVRVHVSERVDEPIRLSHYDLIVDGLSGTKPEYGPDAAEFAPIPAGQWTVSLPNLGVSVEIQADGYNLIEVEFVPVAATEATETAQAAATATPTPVPATPTPAATSTATSTPTPAMQWVGAVLRHDRSQVGQVFAAVAVRINGRRDLPVRLTSGDTTLTCNTGTKPEYGDYACEFGGLSPGTYSVQAEGLEPTVPLMVGQGDFVLVEFREEPIPPGPTVWLGHVVRNSSQPWPGNGVSSAIAVRVEGRRGQVVSLRSVAGWEAFCDTGTKPEYGDYACEFGGLWPGVYTVSPVDIPAEVRLYVDGVGFAEVAFESFLATATPSPTPTRFMGAGASPVQTPTPTPTTPSPTSTAAPTSTAPIVSPTSTSPRPPVTLTPTQTLTPTLSPTPAQGWVGHVVQDEPLGGVGTIVVHVLGLKDQPVVLSSGPWSVRGLSGSKPEYGDYAVEFGGLHQGEYNVQLEGLGASLPVQLGAGAFLVVEFRFDTLPTPTPTPQSGVWVGAVTQNTSGNGYSGAWSTLTIKVPGSEGLPVMIDSGGGFTTTCVTGSKPEYGPGACQVGGLWPGTYRVTPEGLGPSVDVWLDGQGSATVEFWIR